MNSFSKTSSKFLHFGFSLALVILLSLLCIHIKNAVIVHNDEIHPHSPDTAEESLIHANTLYWYARSNGNTIYEFEQAESLAKQALKKLTGKTDSFSHSLRVKAIKIIKNAEVIKNQSALSVNNQYPYFLDFSGQNTLQDEDNEYDQLDRVATKKVLENLIEIPEIYSSKTIKDFPYFTILLHTSTDPELSEAAVQLLNLKSKHYTISDHEIAQILNKEVFNLNNVTKDTAAMEKICSFFNTGQIAIINIVKQDEYDGIFYYGASLKLYAPKSDKNDQIRYTEAFVKMRGYNAMLGIKIPLFISYLLWLILGAEILFFFNWFSFERIGRKRLLLTGTISLVINIICIEGLAYLWNPESGEFAGTDKAMVWIAGVALAYTVFPVLFGHLTVGKLDIFVKSFDSALDDRNGLLCVVFPGLSVYAVSLAYYNLLKFGIGPEMLIVPFACLYALIMALLVSHSWKRVKELPARTGIPQILITYGVTILTILGVFMYPYLTFGVTNAESTIITFLIWVGVPVIFTLLSESNWIKTILAKLSDKNEEEIIIRSRVNKDILPFDIEKEITVSLTDHRISIIYGSKRMGKTTLTSKLIRHLHERKEFETLIYIDLGEQQKEYKYKLNYYPFVLGFGHLLPENVFNDQAEEARKSGNIIGKVISAITSAGDFLVDDSESKPAEIVKLRNLLLRKLREKKSLIVFENVHLCQGESKELLLSLLQGIMEVEAEEALIEEKYKDKLNNKNPIILLTSTHGYHIKNQLEVLLESLINIRFGDKNFTLNEKLLSEEQNFPPFFCLNYKSNFLENYISHFKPGVFDKKFLLEKFRKSEKDKSPGIVAELFKKLKGMNVLSFEENQRLKILKRQFEVPDITDELESFDLVIRNIPEDLFEVIRCCAYSALENGEFDLNAVCSILEKNKLEVLNQLKKGEEQNIIYDAKNKNNWYRFNDLRYISVLKKQDGKEIEGISQIGKEFYFRWIQYYMNHFVELSEKFSVHREILVSISERTPLVHDIDPKFAFETLKKLGDFFIKPSISLLDHAHSSYSNALRICISSDQITHQKDHEIAELKVNGILRTLDQKNELHTDEATKILNESAILITHNPSLQEELYYYKYLAYSKSTSYNPDTAQSYILEIERDLNSGNHSFLFTLKLKFLQLLLTPKSRASVDELETMRIKFEGLLYDIESNPSLLAENEEIYHQILNNLGGSILADELIGKLSNSENRTKKEAYFLESVRLLTKRVQCEFDKCKLMLEKDNSETGTVKTSITQITQQTEIYQELQVISPTSVEEALDTIHQISTVLGQDKYRYTVDKKGLSYTLNYLTRAVYHLITDNHKFTYSHNENLDPVLIQIADLAFDFNEEVHDSQGYNMAASFRGLIQQLFQRPTLAFEDFERTFVHSFGNNQFQTNMSLNNMKALLSLFPNELVEAKQKFNDYNEQNTARHLLRHFKELSEEDIHTLIEKNVITDKEDLNNQISIKGSKFDPVTFKDPFKVIKFLHNVINEKKDLIRFEGGKAYLEFEHTTIIGTDNVVSIDNLPKKHTIKTTKREGTEVFVIENYPSPPTKYFCVILSDDLISIFTAHPGKLAPEFPRKDLSEDKLTESKEFWKNHAFTE